MAPPEAVEIRNGEIWMWSAGRFRPVSRLDAALEALALQDSPYPATQRRFSAIAKALRQTRKEDQHGHAH